MHQFQNCAHGIVVKHSNTPFLFLNRLNKICYSNGAANNFFLYSDRDLVDAEIETILEFSANEFLNLSHGNEIKAFALPADGQKIPVEIIKSEPFEINGEEFTSISVEKSSYEKYHLGKDYLINSTTDMIWSIGKNFELTAANISFIAYLKNITGTSFKAGDNLTKHPFTEKIVEAWKDVAERVFKGQRIREMKHIPSFIDPDEGWAELAADPIISETGEVIGISCHLTDRTESILAQRQLQESEANLAQAQKLAKLGNWSRNLVTDKVSWSNQMFEIFGITPSSPIQTLALFLRRVHAENRKELVELIKATTKTGKPFTVNYKITTPRGEIKAIEQIGHGEKDVHGNVVRIFGTARDITEAMETEKALRLSNERYYFMAKAAQDTVCDWDVVNDYITRTGDGFMTSFGYGNDVATCCQSFMKLIHPEDVDNFLELQRQKLSDKNENYLGREYRLLKANGEYAHVFHRAYIIRNDKGDPIRLIGMMQNITERIENLNQLKKLKENTDALINNTDNPIWSVDTNFKIITANKFFSKEYAEVSGKKAEEGDDAFLGSPKAAVEFWKKRYLKAFSGKSFSFRHQRVNKFGKVTRYLLVSLAPIVNKNGAVTGAACFTKNITELVTANIRLRESQALFNNIFELSPQPMGLYDSETLRFSEVNQASKKLFGYNRDEFLKLKVTDLVAEKETLKKGLNTFGTIKHRTKTGEVLDVEIFNSELNIDGKKHILAVGVDQTQKLHTDKKVNKAIIKAQENERYEIGSELHDNICQLLASSKMRISMLKEDVPEQKMELYNQSREYLVSALDEIRNLSHRLAPSFFNDKTLEEAFCKLFHSFHIHEKYDIFTHYDENLSDWHLSTEIKLNLYRILQEQLRNIINYANAKVIEVDVVIHKHRLKMRVADDGVGFDISAVKHGIGLSNMRRRAEIFDGSFHLASSPGSGTEITVDLPLTLTK